MARLLQQGEPPEEGVEETRLNRKTLREQARKAPRNRRPHRPPTESSTNVHLELKGFLILLIATLTLMWRGLMVFVFKALAQLPAISVSYNKGKLLQVRSGRVVFLLPQFKVTKLQNQYTMAKGRQITTSATMYSKTAAI